MASGQDVSKGLSALRAEGEGRRVKMASGQKAEDRHTPDTHRREVREVMEVTEVPKDPHLPRPVL